MKKPAAHFTWTELEKLHRDLPCHVVPPGAFSIRQYREYFGLRGRAAKKQIEELVARGDVEEVAGQFLRNARWFVLKKK